MKGHNANFLQYDGSYFELLTCECGKTFTPLVCEHHPDWRDKEIVARKRHILHLEEVAMKADYERRQEIKRANQPPDPFAEFKL